VKDKNTIMKISAFFGRFQGDNGDFCNYVPLSSSKLGIIVVERPFSGKDIHSK